MTTLNTGKAVIDRLPEKNGFAVLDLETVDGFVAQGTSMLFFAGDPAKHKESTDVAVVAPELLKMAPGMKGAVVPLKPDGSKIARRWDVVAYPTLLFLRDGEPLGALARLKDWAVYARDVPKILNGTYVPPRAAAAVAEELSLQAAAE